MTSHAHPIDATRAARGLRVAAALPVAAITLAAAVVYVWQAWRHGSPWLFSDEIEYTWLSRGIAEHGVPSRRGQEYWGGGLYPWLIAPFWWIDDTERAYEAIRVFDAIVMSLAILPAYGLARLVAGRPWALLAAAGSGAIPAFVYAPMIVQETLAYPVAALALWLIARALAERTRWWIAAAVAVSVIAPFVRDQLIVVPGILALAATIVAAQSERMTAWRARWSIFGWVAAVAATAFVLVLMHLVTASRSVEWDVATDRPWKMVELGLWAIGGLAAGLGVVPFVIGLAMTVPARGVERTRAVVAFHAVLVAGLVLLIVYAAAKATYIERVFEPRIVERNLIYASPVLWAATAFFLDRRRISLVGLAASVALTAWALVILPFRLDVRLYSDAPGLSLLTEGARLYGWSYDNVQQILLGLLVLAAFTGLVPLLFSAQRAVAIGLAAACVTIALALSLLTELAATRASLDTVRLFETGTAKPVDWVERATGGAATLYLGTQISDPNGIYLLEFWNRGVERVWSTDGSAPGPAPKGTPDVVSRDGQLSGDPGFAYAVVDSRVDLVGKVIATKGSLRLYRIEEPLRLEQSTRGIFADGWLGTTQPSDSATATYARFSTPSDAPGTAIVTVSKGEAWCGPVDVPGDVLIAIGPLALGPERNGVVRNVTQLRGWQVGACDERTFEIPAPAAPFAVEVRISPTFVPNELDPGNSERRHLTARVSFGWKPGKPAVSAAP